MRNKLTPFSILWLALGLAVNLFYYAGLKPDAKIASWFFDSNVNKELGCDFYALYAAVDNFQKERSIYEGDPDHTVVPCIYGYRYLPLGVAVGLPFSKATPRTAYRFWLILLELLVFVNVALLFWATNDAKIIGLGGFMFMAASPLYLEFYMGQYSLIQATLMFAAFAAWHKNKGALFETFWGATLCWKLNTWIAVPALIRKKRFWGIAGAAVVIVGTSLPYFLKHPDAWEAFTWLNFKADPAQGITRGNLGLVGFLVAWLDTTDPGFLIIGALVSVTAASLAVTILFKRADLIDLTCLWMSAYFLAYKHTWEHHYVMLLPVLVILAVRHKSAFLILPALLIALPTVYPIAVDYQWPRTWELIYHAQKPAAALLTWAFCAVKARK